MWEAALAGLRVFLEEDSEYVQFLESLNLELASKLRFKCRQLGDSVVEAVAFDRFVEAAEQLRYLHTFFQAKLKLNMEAPVCGDSRSADERCSDVVGILGDMLSVLRVVYKQLFCRKEATQAVLEAALLKESEDRNVMERYLTMQQLTPEKLVGRPLKRFDALVEFVEALSKTLSDSGKAGSTTNGTDEDTEAKVNYAPQLMHIAQENKHFIYLAKADVQAENELIALQTRFRGDGAEAFTDLSDNKLLLHGEVFLSLRSQRDSSEVGSATGLLTEPERIYAHIFQDGTLVCSKYHESESEALFMILRCLHLKLDAAFLEHIPTSVSILGSSDEVHGLALILQDATLVFAWNDSTERQRWGDAIGGFLEMNGSRLEILHKGRAISNIPVPEEITAQFVGTDTIPTEFPSFYDDHLPGVFWMAPGNYSKSTAPPCELVEIVFYSRWLLVFKLNGWARHSALCHFDTRAPEMEIGEQPRGDKEWSLVISNGTVDRVTLVSKKRTRIDFWFDQVWKAIDSAKTAARRAEMEKREREEMEQEEAHALGNTRRRGGHTGKKRALKVVYSSGESSADEKQKVCISQSPTGSNISKPDDKTDDECGEQIRGTLVTSTEEDSSTAAPTKKKLRHLNDKSKQPSTTTSDATMASPPMKTPKRRWLKRKSEDPNDTTLLPTQPSPTIPTDESTSEVDATQVPANESVDEEPKPQELRIILTGIEPTAAIRKKIDSIAGAVYEEDIEKATHILAPKNQLKRTVKLLCGISRCTHILDVRWLDESARVGAPIYERAHCLKDAKAEAKWHFDLLKTMYDVTLEQRQQLFAGHQVFITNHKSVLPPVKDLAKIVECAGGIAVTKGSAGPNDVVITSDAALATVSVRKALTQANPQKIYSPELILSSILQQHIDFDKNHLEQSGGGGSRRRR